MNYIKESFLQLLGADPRKPDKEEIKPAARELYIGNQGGIDCFT